MPPGDAPIANVESVKAGLATIGVLVVAPGALPQEVSVVLGSKIIAEWRHFFTAILEVRSNGLDRAENEGEGAHGQKDNRKVGHTFSFAQTARGSWSGMAGQADSMSTVKQSGWVGWSKLLNTKECDCLLSHS